MAELRRLVLATLLAAASGCAVGPNYQTPTTAAPSAWQAPAQAGASALAALPTSDDAQALSHWWTWFEDDSLDALVAMALAQNLDLRAAGARLHAARGERRAAQAGLGPQLGMGVGSQRNQNPMPGLAPGLTFTLHEVGFDARWEIDLFGRQKRRVEAADAVIAAHRADLEAAVTVLCAEVARSYWEMRAADAQVALLGEAIALAREQGRHAARLADAGIGRREDVLEANDRVAGAQVQLAAQEYARGSAQRQIEQLLAVQPGQLAVTLHAREQALPVFAPRLLLTPAAVLRNRPDIQRAERQLAAATALKAAAIADMYPRVSLAVFFGLRNTALSGLMSIASKSWSGGATMLQPLFDAGRLRAMLEVRDAGVEAALVEYERATLAALHETENALAQWLTAERTREARDSALAERATATRLAHHRQAQGMAGAQEVIATELALLNARSELRASEAEVTVATVAVLKALGAGISPQGEPALAQATRP